MVEKRNSESYGPTRTWSKNKKGRDERYDTTDLIYSLCRNKMEGSYSDSQFAPLLIESLVFMTHWGKGNGVRMTGGVGTEFHGRTPSRLKGFWMSTETGDLGFLETFERPFDFGFCKSISRGPLTMNRHLYHTKRGSIYTRTRIKSLIYYISSM